VPTAIDDQRQRANGPNESHGRYRGRLPFRFVVSVTSDAEAMVPTGAELTLFEAVDRSGL